MKNLYNKKGKVHPSPLSLPDQLSLLPATILTLAAALSEQDKQVLAYLIITNNNNFTNHQSKTTDDDESKNHHEPMFNCNCFNCYMSYWVRWDTSSNREMIHDIIEAYEEGLLFKKKKKKSLKKKKDKSVVVKDNNRELDSVEKNSCNHDQSGDVEVEASTVRKITSFIGEKIWGIWVN